MRRSVADLVLASTFVLNASAGASVVIFENLPNVGTGNRVDGTFSDGLASQGLNFYSQAFGQGFQITEPGTAVNSLRIWGSSEFIDGIPPSVQGIAANVRSLEVSIMRVTSGATNYNRVYNRSFTVSSQVTQTATGILTQGLLTPVFQMDIDLGEFVSLGTGSYILSVGGILDNPEGNSFIWNDGVADGDAPATRAYVTVGDTAAQWGYWNTVPGGISASVVMYGVPGPGALALLSIAGLRHGFRHGRRRA